MAPVLAHVLGITHIAASHAVKVGPLNDVDRPLAIARYSAAALPALGNVGRGSPMLATASFAPPANPGTPNERLESGLRSWLAAAQTELNRTVPSSDVIRNVMNQGDHLYAVSARLLEAAEHAGELASDTADSTNGSLRRAMDEVGKADRLWGSVTTAMTPSHEYIAAARQLHSVLTDVTHDGLHPRNFHEITEKLDVGQALSDLRYAARDVTDLIRDVQHLPHQLVRSGLLFSPARNLAPSAERLHERTTGRFVTVLPEEIAELAKTSQSAAKATDLAVREVDHASTQMQHPRSQGARRRPPTRPRT